jgi:hypothetical protein
MLQFKLGVVKMRKKRERSEAGGFYPTTSKLGLGSKKYARLRNLTDASPIKHHKMTGGCEILPRSLIFLQPSETFLRPAENKENGEQEQHPWRMGDVNY